VSLGKVCKHIHVPLESGSARVLDAMRRGYTPEEYAEAVRRVTDRLPSCGLGADVMVGFPGETDRDFEDTVTLVRSLPFTYLHVFAFSPRDRTAAACLAGGVAGSLKRARSAALRALGRQKSLAFRTGLVGSEVEVLTEAPEGAPDRALAGLTSTYVRVRFEGDRSFRNRLVRVRVDRADEAGTWGTADPATAR